MLRSLYRARPRGKIRLALALLLPAFVAGTCPSGDSGSGPNGTTVTITVASGQGEGSGKVSGSGYSCDIVGALASGTCAKAITLNAQIALAATAAAGSVFAGWGGSCANAGVATCLLTASAASTATARFDLPTFALAVTSGGGTGNGTVTGNGVNCAIAAATQSGTCTVNFAPNANVVLTAAAAAGHVFEGWGGACTGTATTCNVSMSAARSVTARFAAPVVQFALTVTSGGGTGSGTVTGGAINCNIAAATQSGTCNATLNAGTVVTLTATPTAGHTFAGWGGGVCTGTATTCDVTMSQARTVTASFTAPASTFALTVASGGGTGNGSVSGGGIACTITGGAQSGTCLANIASGTVVTLTAAPSGGHTFASWGGACAGSALTCNVTMSQARSVTASFTAPVLFTLTVTAGVGTGNGTVTEAAVNCNIVAATQNGTCAADYAAGTIVLLTATPNAGGHTFAGWGGACAGVTLTCSVTMSQARAVTASFTAPIASFALTVTSGGGTGNGAVTGSGVNCTVTGAAQSGTCGVSFASGTVVTLTATPAVGGHTFAGWGGACAGTGSCVVTMSQARAVTASFTAPISSFALTVTSGGGTGNGAVTGGGITCDVAGVTQSGTCSANIASGTIVTLTAAPAVGGHTFATWGGACAGALTTCNVTMSQARAVTATFTAPVFALSVTSGGGTGDGSVSGNGIACNVVAASQSGTCSVNLASGTPVTLTATPSGGHTFAGWGGACAGTGTCNTTMSQARAVTANFTAPVVQFALTVTAGAGNGEGTVTATGVNCAIALNGAHVASQSGTCTNSFNTGTIVALTATPGTDGQTFVAWGGACAGNGACNVTMSQARAVTAKFNAPSFASLYTSVFGSATCTSGCHSTAFNTQGNAHTYLLGVTTTRGGFPLATAHMNRVTAWDPSTSYLLDQLNKTTGAYGMPLVGTISGASFLQIAAWIRGGALASNP